MSEKGKPNPKKPEKPKKPKPFGFILSWMCEKCGWMNDNNNGPCRKCGAP